LIYCGIEAGDNRLYFALGYVNMPEICGSFGVRGIRHTPYLTDFGAMDYGTIKLFLAEDDDDDSHFFQRAVREIPVAVDLIRARDGVELMDLLQASGKPDFVFLDINMPRKNGFQCLSEIRANSTYTDLPVIVFSTTSADDLVARMYSMGANAFIIKPINFKKWRVLIERAITTDWSTYKPGAGLDGFILTVNEPRI